MVTSKIVSGVVRWEAMLECERLSAVRGGRDDSETLLGEQEENTCWGRLSFEHSESLQELSFLVLPDYSLLGQIPGCFVYSNKSLSLTSCYLRSPSPLL